MRRKFLSLLLGLTLCVGLLPTAAALEPTASSNAKMHSYNTWARPVNSYLYDNGSGLTRVEYTGGKVVVEDWSADFELLENRSIEPELPIFGGFYAGEDSNFLFFGQDNTEEDDNKEVIRVVRYDKDWNRVDDTGLFGANTVHPFDAGSLRCDEYGGYLYVRTCHEMYTSSDGLNHQANVTFSVRESDMEITDAFYDVMNVSYGYVSHSFNQFILVDEEGNLIAADHGDAYPRSHVLMRYPTKAGADKFVPSGWSDSTTVVNLVEFPGNIGQNSTGSSLGGLAETTEGYVAAYNLCGNGSFSGGGQRDVYLGFVPKDSFSEESMTTAKLTAVPGSSTPVLVPTGLTGGYVLWDEMLDTSSTGNVCYAPYNADGTVGQVSKAQGTLSDCQPIPYGDGIVWYATNAAEPTFYVLTAEGLEAHPTRRAVGASDWAEEEVTAAIRLSLVPDELCGRYQDDITRQDFCRVMVRLVERDSGQSARDYLTADGKTVINPFVDTSDSNVLAAYVMGIVNGTGDGTTFSPYGSITRQEAAAMLARTARLLGRNAGAAETFADAEQFPGWAAQDIAFVSGLTDGETGKAVMGSTGGGNFSPTASYTREQAYITALRMFRSK